LAGHVARPYLSAIPSGGATCVPFHSARPYPFAPRERRSRVGQSLWRWAGANGPDVAPALFGPRISALRRLQANR